MTPCEHVASKTIKQSQILLAEPEA
jgi:hypothetical protein